MVTVRACQKIVAIDADGKRTSCNLVQGHAGACFRHPDRVRCITCQGSGLVPTSNGRSNVSCPNCLDGWIQP